MDGAPAESSRDAARPSHDGFRVMVKEVVDAARNLAGRTTQSRTA